MLNNFRLHELKWYLALRQRVGGTPIPFRLHPTNTSINNKLCGGLSGNWTMLVCPRSGRITSRMRSEYLHWWMCRYAWESHKEHLWRACTLSHPWNKSARSNENKNESVFLNYTFFNQLGKYIHAMAAMPRKRTDPHKLGGLISDWWIVYWIFSQCFSIVKRILSRPPTENTENKLRFRKSKKQYKCSLNWTNVAESRPGDRYRVCQWMMMMTTTTAMASAAPTHSTQHASDIIDLILSIKRVIQFCATPPATLPSSSSCQCRAPPPSRLSIFKG